MKNQDLVVAQSNKKSMAELTSFSTMEAMKEYYAGAISSNFLPNAIQEPEQAIVIVQMGAELGLSPMTAFNNISIIQNKPVLGWRGQVALVQKYGVIVDVVESFIPKANSKGEFTGNKETIVEITRKYDHLGGLVKVHRFAKSWAECTKAGWTDKDNWKKYPINMLRARTITDALALYCADMLNGIYSTEELADSMGVQYDTDAEGNTVLYDKNGNETKIIK
jgi:hypothetical protein